MKHIKDIKHTILSLYPLLFILGLTLLSYVSPFDITRNVLCLTLCFLSYVQLHIFRIFVFLMLRVILTMGKGR